MRKGTIYYVGGFELPDKNAAAHRVLANGMIMRDLGYDVVFVGVRHDNSDGIKLVRRDFFGFECWSVPYPSGWRDRLKYICGLKEVLKLLQKARSSKVVAVICYNFSAIAQLRIILQGRRSGIKTFADATEWYDSSGGRVLHRIVKFLDTSLRMYLANRICDGIITTSRYITEFYEQFGKRTVELPTLFDADKFPPPTRKLDLKKSFIYVGSPFDEGRVNKSRSNLKERLDLCIDLFYQLFKSEYKFLFEVYGVDLGAYLRVFPEHSGILQEMSGCVIFKGRQPNQVVLSRIAESDFSIFFRDENRVTLAGFPSKLAESISCGTPVISNKMPSLESYKDCEAVFLSDRGQELVLLEKIMTLSIAKIESLKKVAYRSKTFDYRNYIERLRSFLEVLEGCNEGL